MKDGSCQLNLPLPLHPFQPNLCEKFCSAWWAIGGEFRNEFARCLIQLDLDRLAVSARRCRHNDEITAIAFLRGACHEMP
jgi:hypothetical protein